MFAIRRFLVVAAIIVAAVAIGDADPDAESSPIRSEKSQEGSSSTEADVVDAREEGSVVSSSAIEPDLPFSDINILVVSDVHSFVGGHPHEPDRNADYGDLFSFHERLKEHCEAEGKGDLFLFNNGDWLHGTGLAMDGNATNLLPIVNAMPWDSLTMGRQEATYTDVLRDMSETMLPAFHGKYITSNVVWNETKEPYGKRYQFLKGRNSTILVFGFLYDVASPSTTIQVVPVEEAIQQEWFQSLLRDDYKEYEYDAIVVLAQIDVYSPLIEDIYEAIRENVDPNMPIQFIAGHSHKRERVSSIKRDFFVHKMEPGGLFDTIGWVTIPKFEATKGWSGKSQELKDAFRQEFLNTSKTVLRSRLGLRDEDQQGLETAGGRAISKMIHNTQERLELNQIVACPGHDYFRNISIHADNSLWKLWREHVVRTQIFKKAEDRVIMVSKRTFRYDLRGSGKHDAMTLDDVVAIAPYMQKVIYVGDVPDWMIRRMNNTFNTFSHHNIIPDYVLAGDIDDVKTAESYQLYTHEEDVPKIKAKLEKFNFKDFVLKPTGQRDTLYWLNYVRNAYPCKGSENEKFKVPYFYDPNELEEESTDGKVTSDEMGLDFDEQGSESDTDEEIIWTLPPGEEYKGYIPGKGEVKKVPVSVYENYKTQEERDKEKQEKKAAAASRLSSKNLKSQLQERKKTHKKIVKGFAVVFAFLILFIPVVCLIMQVTGRNDDNDGFGSGGALYDQEEMRLLKRRRRGATKKTRSRKDRSGSFHERPLKEIEII